MKVWCKSLILNKKHETTTSHTSPAECIHVLPGSISCALCLTHNGLCVYFVDGVQCSAGEYGTGYLHIGTKAFLPWSWFLLYFSSVSNLLWLTLNHTKFADSILSVQLIHASVLPAHLQMLSVRCRSTRVLSPCTMPRWTQISTTMSTWSCSEPRGTSTYLASLSSSVC